MGQSRSLSFSSSLRGLVNTFQVVVASDGGRTFVRFNYGDIQWGGSSTLIGVSAGDGVNFITHLASLSPSILSLDNTAAAYRIDGKFRNMFSALKKLFEYLSHAGTAPPV